jgi:hypothetical protein
LFLVELLDASSGTTPREVLLSGSDGAWSPGSVLSTGDSFVVTRKFCTLVYSWKTGQRIGKIPGPAITLLDDGSVIAVSGGKNSVEVYDLRRMRRTGTCRFLARPLFVRFSGAAERMFVLSAAQTAYLLRLAD